MLQRCRCVFGFGTILDAVGTQHDPTFALCATLVMSQPSPLLVQHACCTAWTVCSDSFTGLAIVDNTNHVLWQLTLNTSSTLNAFSLQKKACCWS